MKRVMRDSLKGDARATEQLLRLVQYWQQNQTASSEQTPSTEEDMALLKEAMEMAGVTALVEQDNE